MSFDVLLRLSFSALAAGGTSTRQAAAFLDRLAAYPDSAVWISRASASQIDEQLEVARARQAAGVHLPLLGVPFAVKDNIDVAGLPTTAACKAFGKPATVDAPAVKRLRDAGAIVVGKTNLDQFATGLCGDRSPYGSCANVFASEYVSGGSSSGSAVAVAAGLVSFALGTDTAGSGRVPAGCNNIVGLKPTPGLIDTTGVVPACPSLDCVSIFALTAQDAWQVASIAQGVPKAPTLGEMPTRFVALKPADLEFFGDRGQEELYRQSLTRLERMGLVKSEIDFTPFRETAKLLYEGPWISERFASLEAFLASNRDDIHPVTRTILETGAKYRAADLFRGLARLDGLRRECQAMLKGAVLVVPTMPTIPKRADVATDSLGWSRRMGTYTNFVNLLGMAALSVPAGFTPEGLPGGVTFIGPGGSDRLLCGLGVAFQRNTNLPLGATKTHLPEPTKPVEPTRTPVPEGCVRVSVAGAHLKGQPLHPDLVRFGAKFVRVCDSAPRYRFMAFLHLTPPRPGLLWDETRNGAIRLEIYDLPFEGFGKLVASVAPPLAIGTVELEDGEKVKGFLCESWAARSAEDITDFGGWIAFRTGGGR
jgi:allophanate hydrolase